MRSALKQNLLTIYGEDGETWFNNLPNLIQILSIKWRLSQLKPIDNLSYHYVVEGYQAKAPVILKLGFDKTLLQREALALGAFANYGCVKLLAHDLEQGALLLEKASPGTSLKAFFPQQEHEAIKIACLLMVKLHQAPIKQALAFPHLADWLSLFNRNWPIPIHYLDKARTLSKKLLTTAHPPVLLHGDLHHDNILSYGKSWVAIDPKGVWGEATYDLTAFLFNPILELVNSINPLAIIQSRIALFSAHLKIGPQRIAYWGFVKTILSTCWAIDDHLDPNPFLNFANLMHQIIV